MGSPFVMIRLYFKLQFCGVFTQAEDNTHLNARVLPHPLRGSPLPEGAIYLSPRKSLCPISDFAPRPKAPSGRELPPAGG